MTTRTLISIYVLLGALAVAGCADDSPEKHLAAAKQHLEKKDNKAAVIEIKNALQKNPDLGEARLMLANALMQDGNPVAAEVEFRKALASGVPPAQVVPELARAMLQVGAGKKVVDEFNSTSLGNPAADARLQTTLASAYATLGKFEQARVALDAALAADPGYAPAQLISARQKASNGDAVGANNIVNAVLAKNPVDADALRLQGDLLTLAKKPDEALAAYNKALKADPKYLPAHFSALTLLMQQARVEEGAKQLDRLKEVAPRSPQTKFYEAQLAFLQKDLKRARQLAVELVQQVSNNALVLQLAGATELQAGSLAQAEIYLSKALQLAPRLALARRLLIATHLRTGQAAKALAELSAATGKDGSLDPTLYSLAGQVYLQNGNAGKAEEYFTKALKLDPSSARHRTALAITHLIEGQSADALDDLQDIAAADTGVTADLALISAHLRRRDYDRALAAVDRLEKKQPDRPVAADIRGRVLLAKKDIVGARQSFERALTIDPGFFGAAAALAALDVAEKKPDQAKKRLEAFLDKNPKSTQAWLALAQLGASGGASRDEISTLLVKAIEASPTDAAPRLLLIDLYLREKNNKQALVAAQSAVSTIPNDWRLLGALGRAQLVSGDTNQALATFGRLVSLQPLSPDARINLAEAQLANRQTQAARESFRKALDIKSDHLEAQRWLIVLDIGAKNYADALKTARAIQEQRPKESVGFELEATVAGAQRNWNAAAAAYRGALQRKPSTAVAQELYSAQIASGKTTDADAFGQTWMREHPRDAEFVLHQGNLALARNDLKMAEKHYLAALRIQPDSAAALNNLAWVVSRLGKGGALDYAERANQLAPDKPAFMDTLAMLLAERNELARAAALQSKAVALQPDNPELRLNLARIYVKAGDKPRAKAELETLAKLGDKFPSQAEVAALQRTL